MSTPNPSILNAATAHKSDQKTLSVGRSRLKFPVQADNPAYSGRISFETLEFEPVGLNSEKILSLAPVDNVTGWVKDLLTSDDDDAGLPGDTALSAEEEAARIKKTMKENKSKTIDEVASILNGDQGANPVEGAPIIDLFFPLSIQMDDTMDIGTGNLGGLGVGVLTGLKEAGSIWQGINNSVQKGMSDIFQFAFGGLQEETARYVAAKVGKMGPQGIQTAISVANQVAVNPHTRAVFNQVNLRQFSFTFKLIPASSDEALVIQKIIKHFRTHMYPETFDVAGLPLGYKFPKVFRISFKHRNSEAKIPRLELCYLRGFQSTYNPTGQAFYNDGQPNEIDITLQFQEYRTLSKKDIEEKGF